MIRIYMEVGEVRTMPDGSRYKCVTDDMQNSCSNCYLADLPRQYCRSHICIKSDRDDKKFVSFIKLPK